MNAILGFPANASPSQPELFDRLLRRAAAYCWLQRFKQQISRGAHTVGHMQIGETAGVIWETLSKQGPLPFAALMEEVNVPQSLFFMAIGWLSREDKVHFERADGDYLVRLA
ncbi:MAG TPA: winged helix-turn-helix domain-containing protein [Candidatus Acidoferrum sp.]|nr:winged helix-turn-helix domain-containing protein [Candidatus Acidoferrum sp.]